MEVRQSVETQVLRKVFVIRGYPRDERLHFSSFGKTLTTLDPGAGALDGEIAIDGVQIESHSVILSGSLPTVYFDLDSGKAKFHEGTLRRSVTVDVADPASAESILDSVWHTLYTPREAAAGDCSSEESAYFQSEMRTQIARLAKKRPDERAPICLPGGERVGRVGGSVQAPKAYSTPDPAYTESARARKISGQSMLGMVVDSQGRPSSVMIFKSLEPGLDENAVKAVRTWKFHPATKDGQPMPVLINIEMNFQVR